MRSMLHADEEEDRESRQPEINLSAASLLGIFVALVLICGVFFGFGYSVGRRPMARANGSLPGSNPGAVPGSTPGSTADSTPSATPGAMPSGAAATPSAKPGQGAAPEVNTSALPTADLPTPVSGSQGAQSVDLPIDETPPPELAPSSVSLRRHTPLAKPSPAAAPMPVSTASAASVSNASPAIVAPAVATQAHPAAGGTMVQVAAVVHQEDADVLVSALRRKGYTAVVRNGTQDKLLHIQIGPYSSRAQALDMRQKLLSDGYNAILK